MKTQLKNPSLISKGHELEENTKPFPESEKQEEKRQIDESRERLKEMSQNVKELVANGTYPSINEAIINEIYRDDANQDFKNYDAWKSDGMQVKKGEKAYLLWARPKEVENEKPTEGKEEKKSEGKEPNIEEMHTFYPISYVFSNNQVIPLEKNKENEKEIEMDLNELESVRHESREFDQEVDR